jgi:hypothetical protein
MYNGLNSNDYVVNNIVTPWYRILFGKLIVTQLIKQ